MTFDRLSADPLRPDTDDEPWTWPPQSKTRCGRCGHGMHWKVCGPACACRNDESRLTPKPPRFLRTHFGTSNPRGWGPPWVEDRSGDKSYALPPRHMKARFDGLHAYESKTAFAFILPGRRTWALVVAAPFVAVAVLVIVRRHVEVHRADP
jgi:hypothetical protein